MYCSRHCLLIDAAHHIVHSTGDILTNRTTDSHTCHHSSHIKACSIAASTNVYITSSVSSHLSESLCTSNANLCLFFNLESTNISGLGLFMLCILSFFTLDAESTFVVFSFNTLLIGNILNSGFCFGFCSCPSKIFGHAHKLTIAITGLVNFNRTNINSRYNNTEVFFQAFAEVILNHIIDLSCFAFNLNNGNIVCSRSVRNSIFYITVDCITNLSLEIIEIKATKPM